MFRDLIPLLADRFHIVAPDLPGFGKSDMPGRGHTFDRIAETIDRFTELVGFDRYAVYVFDYGAPTGFRLAVKHPGRITAIISQNGNAYEEGLSDGWNPIRAYWQEASQANREALRKFLAPETTVWQYTHGEPRRRHFSSCTSAGAPRFRVAFIFCRERNRCARCCGRLTAISRGGLTKCRQPPRDTVDSVAAVTWAGLTLSEGICPKACGHKHLRPRSGEFRDAARC
jgi:pimeloyl-ACP methyl ester carboxylesterase